MAKKALSAVLFVLLAVVYFGLVTPISLVARLFGDPLGRKNEPDDASCFVPSRAVGKRRQ